MSVLSRDKRGYILQVEKKNEKTDDDSKKNEEDTSQEAGEESENENTSSENTTELIGIDEEETENPNVVPNPYEVETNESGEVVSTEGE